MTLLYRILKPKSPVGWILLLALLFMFGVAVAPKLVNPKGALLVTAALAGAAGLGALTPGRWLIRFECLPHAVRGLLLGFVAYAAMVTLGNFEELYNFRVWREFVFITPKGAVPFSPVHATAVMAAVYVFAAQRYVLWFPTPKDRERIVTGQLPISYEQAKQRAEQLFRR